MSELRHGESGFVDQAAWWVDLSSETWVNGYDPYLHANDVPTRIEQAVSEAVSSRGIEVDPDDLLNIDVNLRLARIGRVLIPEAGLDSFVVDSSDGHYIANGDAGEKIVRTDGPVYGHINRIAVKKMPVLAWIGNKAQLELAEAQLKSQYGVDLGMSVGEVVAEYNSSSQGD